MNDKKNKKTSDQLKKALQVEVSNDKNGKPVLVNKGRSRGMLWTKINGVFKNLMEGPI